MVRVLNNQILCMGLYLLLLEKKKKISGGDKEAN